MNDRPNEPQPPGIASPLFEDLDIDRATSAECAQAAAVELGIRAGGAEVLEALPRLAPPVAFEPNLPPWGARPAAKEVERAVCHALVEDDGEYCGWHRRWDLTFTCALGFFAECDDCGTRHTAPTRGELVELLDAMHVTEPDPDEAWERARDLR